MNSGIGEILKTISENNASRKNIACDVIDAFQLQKKQNEAKKNKAK